MTQITVRGTGTLDGKAEDFKFTKILHDAGDYGLRELEAWIVDMLKMHGWQREFTVCKVSSRWIHGTTFTKCQRKDGV